MTATSRGRRLASAGTALASAVVLWAAGEMPSRALDLGALHWRNIGPAVAGGRVAAVAGTDADPSLYYVGAAGGGVWRTSDGGLTWKDVFSRQPAASIGALAIAPSNRNIVWVGTGESKPRNDTSLGNGVWVSNNGGVTWKFGGVGSPSIARILVARRNSNVVLVGALGDPYRDSSDRGVYRTSDGGKSWRQTLYVGPSSGVSDLAWDTRTNSLVFAGIWQIRRVPWSFASGGPQDGLYRSHDGGRTWRKLLGHGLPSGFMGRIGVAVAPSNPRRVYALIQSKDGSLWRSDDGGDSWRLVTRDSDVNQRPFYMSRLEVDPKDQNHVFFLSEDLVESHDGGKTFFNNANEVHQDHHAMWIASNGQRMIEGNDGGAPISLDGGKTWDWRYNLTIGQIYHAGYDLDVPYHVCGGLQDNDSYCGPSDSLNPLGILNEDWWDVGSNGDGSWTWPDARDSRYVWNVDVRDLNGQLTIYDRRTRESYDITPYVRDTNGAAIAGLPYRFNWEAPLAFSKVEPGVAYFGGNVVWKTSDRGRHWQTISPDLTRNEPAHQQVAGGPINTDVSGAEFYDTIVDIAPAYGDGGIIWVGTDDGLVQLTRDGGKHWSNVTPAVPAYGRVETVEPSFFDRASAFAVVDRHMMGDRSPYLFATSDYGSHWKSIAGDLPSDEIVHVVRQDLHDAGILYAGSESGVWITLDGGTHWQRFNNNMPTVSVHDLQIQPRQNDLIAATHGRGFWVMDDLSSVEAAAGGVKLLFPPRPAYTFFRWWEHEYASGAQLDAAPQGMFSGENPPAGALLNYWLDVPLARAPTLQITDSQGGLIAHVSATNKGGLNRVAWDLAQDAPVPWYSARPWNQGPSQGPTVVPGTYTVTLRAGSVQQSRTLVVRPDPRAPWTQDQYIEARDFMRRLYGWLSQVDSALNNLDRIRSRLFAQIVNLESSHGSGAELARRRAWLHEAQAVSAELSSNPRNSEDNQWKPDRVRERLLTLIDVYSALAQGPPLPPHRREAAELKVGLDAAWHHYQQFVSQLGSELH